MFSGTDPEMEEKTHSPEDGQKRKNEVEIMGKVKTE